MSKGTTLYNPSPFSIAANTNVQQFSLGTPINTGGTTTEGSFFFTVTGVTIPTPTSAEIAAQTPMGLAWWFEAAPVDPSSGLAIPGNNVYGNDGTYSAAGGSWQYNAGSTPPAFSAALPGVVPGVPLHATSYALSLYVQALTSDSGYVIDVESAVILTQADETVADVGGTVSGADGG